VNTGWGIIDFQGSNLLYVAHGVVKTSSTENIGIRLGIIYRKLSKIIDTFKPTTAAVEEIFLNKNPHSTIKLGMARGVVILAPASFSIPVSEYSANKVKKTVVGTGHADKNQITQMLKVILPKAGEVTADAADALAVAICHAQHQGCLVA